MENKKFNYEVNDGKLVISVDPNEDGEPVLRLELIIAEIPDEVLSTMHKK